MLLTVTLNPALDYHLHPLKKAAGRVIRAESGAFKAGGKGVNVGRIYQSLGGKSLNVVPLGGDLGRYYQSLTRQERLRLKIVPMRRPPRINVTMNFWKGSGDAHYVSRGLPFESGGERKILKVLLKEAVRSRLCVFAGSLPPRVSSDFYREAVSRLQAKGIPCVVDSSGTALRQALLARPYGIKPNREELETLAGGPLKTLKDVVRFAIHQTKHGISEVIVSMDAQGALFVSQKATARHVAPPRKLPGVAVGAGDALLGAYLWALKHQPRVSRRAQIAVAVSWLSMGKWDVRRLWTAGEVRRIADKLRVKEISYK